MTHPGLLITLTADVDAATGEEIAELLRQIRGIADVSLVDGDPTLSLMIEKRADAAWRRKIADLAHSR